MKLGICGLVGALVGALAVIGCEDDGGGTGGTGGAQTANVTVAHMAPGIPNVDIYVKAAAETASIKQLGPGDEPAVADLAYGESDGKTELSAGAYDIFITLASNGAGGNGGQTGGGGNGGAAGGGGNGGTGGPEVVFQTTATLPGGADVTIAAYRTRVSADAPVDVFVLNNELDDNEIGETSSLITVSHGAPRPQEIDIVDVYTVNTDDSGGMIVIACAEMPIVDNLEFGTSRPSADENQIVVMDLETVNIALTDPAGVCVDNILTGRTANLVQNRTNHFIAVTENADEELAQLEIWQLADGECDRTTDTAAQPGCPVKLDDPLDIFP